jgi:hypothetical protein
MKRFILPLTALLLFTGAAAGAAQSKVSDDGCQRLDEKTAALISQYKELRNRRRQLPEGKRERDLDDDGGKLSRVLSTLGEELGRPPHRKETIHGCLGEPDAVRVGESMKAFLGVYERELKKAGRKVEGKSDREYLIYFWRGWHDFLFFISEDGLIVDYGWWFAYE